MHKDCQESMHRRPGTIRIPCGNGFPAMCGSTDESSSAARKACEIECLCAQNGSLFKTIQQDDVRDGDFPWESPKELEEDGELDELERWNKAMDTCFFPIGRWGPMLVLRDRVGFWVVDCDVFKLIVRSSDGNAGFLRYLRRTEYHKPLDIQDPFSLFPNGVPN